MKKLFFSLVALMVAIVSFAQNTLVATLSHGEGVPKKQAGTPEGAKQTALRN